MIGTLGALGALGGTGVSMTGGSLMVTITFGSTGMETTGGSGGAVMVRRGALGGATAGPATGSTARAALVGGIAPDERARRGVDWAGFRVGAGTGGVPSATRPMGRPPSPERTGMRGIAELAELAGRLSGRVVAAGGGGGGRLVGRVTGCMPRRSVCA
jgi:hypothetical protein